MQPFKYLYTNEDAPIVFSKTFMNHAHFLDKSSNFLSALSHSMEKQEFSLLAHWHVDHLCYRVETLERYAELKKQFQEYAELLVESPINGRFISTFKLHKPLFFENWQIDLLELPAPKAGAHYAEGFEHIEVVCDICFEKLAQMYSKHKSFAGGLNKNFNHELAFSLESGTIKFHQLSLESVVTLENNSKVWKALQESRVLELLKKFQPLVAGTFPLGIYTNTSDLDILCSAEQLPHFLEECRKHFSSLASYSEKSTQVNGEESALVRFQFQEIPFELFAQKNPSIEQRAYKHFLVEERLLKIGGEKFREKILSLRAQGLKTEPAFAKALELKGDPHANLLELQTKSNNELLSVLRSGQLEDC